MAAFDKNNVDYEVAPGRYRYRLDFDLFRHGPVSKFYNRQILEDFVQWLQAHEYQVRLVDCSTCSTDYALLTAIGHALEFENPDFNRVHLDSFDDWLCGIDVPHEGGVVLVLLHFDLMVDRYPEMATDVLDILARELRTWLVVGEIFMILVQSDDPRLDFPRLGGQRPEWNNKEMFNKSRGL